MIGNPAYGNMDGIIISNTASSTQKLTPVHILKEPLQWDGALL